MYLEKTLTVSVNFSVGDQRTVRIDSGEGNAHDSDELRVHLPLPGL
jgi:hypothetical protein